MGSIAIQRSAIQAGLFPAISRSGLQLTPSDIAMIRSVFEYRTLHIDHLSALTNRSYKKVHGRLLKLVQNHFLARFELPFQKHIYVIGREGINVLVDQGIASRGSFGTV